ncbi:MAG: L-threonylcarbamoyladenylate synthase [Gemmatimonadales bacterium]
MPRDLAHVSLAFGSGAEIAAALPSAVQHLLTDRVIAYPTETVYGLGGRVTPAALASLRRVKGRAAGKAFVVLVAGRKMAEEWGIEFPGSAPRLADKWWPGPLTLVLPAPSGRFPQELRGPAGGVAIRQSPHAGARALVEALNEPLTSTSANRPGGVPAQDARAIGSTFAAAVAAADLLVLDGGTLPPSLPSTVVEFRGDEASLVREGAIAWHDVRRTLRK